jgi:hypothetical protein
MPCTSGTQHWRCVGGCCNLYRQQWPAVPVLLRAALSCLQHRPCASRLLLITVHHCCSCCGSCQRCCQTDMVFQPMCASPLIALTATARGAAASSVAAAACHQLLDLHMPQPVHQQLLQVSAKACCSSCFVAPPPETTAVLPLSARRQRSRRYTPCLAGVLPSPSYASAVANTDSSSRYGCSACPALLPMAGQALPACAAAPRSHLASFRAPGCCMQPPSPPAVPLPHLYFGSNFSADLTSS